MDCIRESGAFTGTSRTAFPIWIMILSALYKVFLSTGISANVVGAGLVIMDGIVDKADGFLRIDSIASFRISESQ